MSKETHAAWVKANPEKGAEYQRRYRAKDSKMSLYRTARQRAKTKGIPFSIEFTDLVFPEVCPILGIKLTSYAGSKNKQAGGRNDSFSIDRIIPELGYVEGNIQIISHRANAMKSDASKEDLIKFSNWVQENYT